MGGASFIILQKTQDFEVEEVPFLESVGRVLKEDIVADRDIGKLDLNLLKVLDALLKERSVTRAADRLNLSQPAMSHALARLRDQLGDPLMVRGSHGMDPTPYAESLIEPLSRILNIVERFFDGSQFHRHIRRVVETTHYRAHDFQCMNVIFSQMIRHPRQPRMHVSTAQIFCRNFFA